jgi:hypothetical protein
MTEPPGWDKAPTPGGGSARFFRAATAGPLTIASLCCRINEERRGLGQECSPVRDWVADWNKWSRGERILAVVVTALLAALPLGVLLTGYTGG